MDPIDTNLDLELLAALADDRLKGEERARAIKMVASSDEALELYANTIRELRGSEAKVIPISTARRWNNWKVMVPVAAAAALAIVMVPRMTGTGKQSGLAAQYAMELAQNPRFAGALHEGWEQRGWAVTRGGGERPQAGAPAAGVAVESPLAFRLGVRSIDLQIALQRSDTALAGRLTGEMLETLRAIGFSELVSASYTELRTRLASDPLARSRERALAAEGELKQLLGSPSFAFGQWVGAADLAAQSHDVSFLRSAHGTQFIRSNMPAGSLTGEDSAALGSIDIRVSQGTDDRALDDVHATLQTVIRRRGS